MRTVAWIVVAGATLASADGVGGVSFGPLVRLADDAATAQILVADVTGDGVNDVVRVPGDAARVTVHPGRGDGAFGAPFDVATSAAAVHVRAARLNADAAFDLVLDHGNVSGVDVLLSDGQGGFTRTTSPASPPAAKNPYAAGEVPSVVDWDGDGRLDVVSLDLAGVLRLRPGDGAGGFGDSRTIVSYGYGSTLSDLYAGDLDGDGDADLARLGSGLDVCWRRADGSLSPGVGLSMGLSDANSLCVGDLDGDGLPDLVAVGGGDLWRTDRPTSAAVFLHSGPAAFAPSRGYAGAPSMPPASAALADLNGDGRPDLVAPFGLWMNRGDGTFGPALAVATRAVCVATGDVAGDGRPDFVFAEKPGLVGVAPVLPSPNAPLHAELSPATLHRGAELDVFVRGAGVAPDAVLDFGEAPEGVVPDAWELAYLRETTPTALRTRVRIKADAVLGPHVLTIVNPDGGSASVPYSIVAGGDALVRLATPERVHVGERLTVALRGTGFVAGATATLSPLPNDFRSGDALRSVVVEESEVVSDRELRVVVSAGVWARPGPWTITVVNGTGVATAFDGLFTVLRHDWASIVTKRGVLKPGAGRGALEASGSISEGFPLGDQPAEIRCGDLTSPLVVRMPPGPEWRISRRGRRAVWTSPRGVSPHARLVLDFRAWTFRIDVSRATIAPPLSTELGVDLTLGERTATSVRTWTRSDDGRFVLKP